MGQRYEILDLIATGGMAEVYRARAVGAGGFEKPVAVKKILPHLTAEPTFVDLLIQEAKVAAGLQHGNIVQVYDLGVSDEGEFFIVMEFVAGRDLGRVLERLGERGRLLPVHEVAYVGRQICAGLDFAHRKTHPDGRPMGIIHRDVSPENVLVSFDGEVKVTDFGIAKAAGRATQTQAGQLKGKYGYMSPEQAGFKAVDHRSDVYNVGIVLYELLAGVPLFSGSSKHSTLRRMQEAVVPDPSEVGGKKLPAGLDAIVMRALRPRPDDRYQTAGEMERDLTRFAAEIGRVATAEDLATRMRSLFGTSQATAAPPGSPRLLTLGAVPEGGGTGAASDEAETDAGPKAVVDVPPVSADGSGPRRPRVPTEDVPVPEDVRQVTEIAGTAEGDDDSAPAAFRETPAAVAVYGALALLASVLVVVAAWPRDPDPLGMGRGPATAVEEGSGAPARLLLLRTEPAGARAFVDGSRVPGRTPMAASLDPDGDETVQVAFVAPGHRRWREPIELEEGARVQAIEADLEQATARVRVRSVPPGAQLTVDGEAAGETPIIVEDVTHGVRRLRLVAPGHAIWERDLHVRRARHGLTVHLVPEDAAGHLEVVAWPDLERVTLGGVHVPLGDAPPHIALRPGEHRVTLRSSRGVEREIEVRVDAGETLRLFVDLAAP